MDEWMGGWMDRCIDWGGIYLVLINRRDVVEDYLLFIDVELPSGPLDGTIQSKMWSNNALISHRGNKPEFSRSYTYVPPISSREKRL